MSYFGCVQLAAAKETSIDLPSYLKGSRLQGFQDDFLVAQAPAPPEEVTEAEPETSAQEAEEDQMAAQLQVGRCEPGEESKALRKEFRRAWKVLIFGGLCDWGVDFVWWEALVFVVVRCVSVPAGTGIQGGGLIGPLRAICTVVDLRLALIQHVRCLCRLFAFHLKASLRCTGSERRAGAAVG